MSILFPSAEAPSAYLVDYSGEYASGIRGVLFDVDNTLVEHGAPATERAKELFERLRELGLKTCIISNNDEERVKPFASAVGSEYVFKAGKPSARGYLEGMQRMGTDREHTLFVGDQIFTDICGANHAGLRSILVRPIGKKEEPQIVLKRYLEKPILFFYHLNQKRKERCNDR